MKPLVRLLDALARGGFRLWAEGEDLVVDPGSRLTLALEAEIRSLKPELLELLRIHGPNLLILFRDAPAWPLPRGRSGPAGDVWRLIGSPVGLTDGRHGLLSLAMYDTRTGRVRCRVELSDGWKLADPEDLLPTLACEHPRAREGRTQ